MSDIAGIISRVWPEWTIEKQIGRGAFGQVFQAVRGELGFETRCAVKAVEVPPDDSETDALRLEGMTEEEIRQYFRRQAESFVGEIRMLDSLKGAPHIVGIEDFRVVEQEDGLSWVILIRMELLTPFPVYVRSAPMTEAETVRLGIELCEAMEVCHGLHVIHRDIKPQNIFVDRFGSYRLGDFGIARKMESMTASMSQKGTYGYLAPEINNGFRYDERVDIYSLGLVMYQLVNENRMPFLSTPEDARNPEKRTSAMTRRLRGEPLPPPCAASPALSDVILKACRYDPDDRFRTTAEMKNAILSLCAAESDDAPAAVPQLNQTRAGCPCGTGERRNGVKTGRDRRGIRRSARHHPRGRGTYGQSLDPARNLRGRSRGRGRSRSSPLCWPWSCWLPPYGGSPLHSAGRTTGRRLPHRRMRAGTGRRRTLPLTRRLPGKGRRTPFL